MALAERAAPRVLAGQPHGEPLEQERSERERFARAPSRSRPSRASRARFSICFLSLGCGSKSVGERRERLVDRARAVRARRPSRRGQDARRLGRRRERSTCFVPAALLRLVERLLQPAAEVVEALLGLLDGELSAVQQVLGVELADAAAIVDLRVHERLGERRLVGLVVAVPAVADEVDDDVAA